MKDSFTGMLVKTENKNVVNVHKQNYTFLNVDVDARVWIAGFKLEIEDVLTQKELPYMRCLFEIIERFAEP